MSIKSANAFLERMKTDEDFRKEVTEIKDSEGRMKFVKSVGFDFTKEESRQFDSKAYEEELEHVVGCGRSYGFDCREWNGNS